MEIREAAYPWQHVRAVGEDVIATEMVFSENHEITSYDVGALLASGHKEVKVRKKPRILIVPTGSELLEPEHIDLSNRVFASGIIESNSYVLSGLIVEDGGIPIRHPIVEDDPKKIQEALLSIMIKELISFSSLLAHRQVRKTIRDRSLRTQERSLSTVFL